MYFNRTFFDIKAAPLHGVAACEIMAEFALFETIRMSKKLDCEIHYIRFLGLPQRCETMNFIALGNWPDKGCLLISPWLGEKGDTVIWQGSLKATGKHAKINFPDYSKMKTIFRIFPGKEMNEWQEALENVDFSANTEDRKMVRSRVEKFCKNYKNAFDEFFPNKNADENQSAPSISFRR